MLERCEIFTVRGANTFQCKNNKIPIDLEKTYLLSGEFHSIGSSLSKLHFGIICYSSNDEEIVPLRVIRKAETRTITALDTSFKSFNLNEDANVFAKGFIGLYYDGNTDKLPDKVIGGYTVEGNAVCFTKELPKDIVDSIVIGTTKVMNHANSKKVYNHSACDGEEVAKEWKQYTATFRGSAWGDIVKGKFRKGTCSACPVVIANSGQDKEAVLEMKNVFLTAICDFS